MASAFEKVLRGGGRLRVDFLTERIARVQVSPDGCFPDTGLNRYGFIFEPADRRPPVAVSERRGRATLRCGDVELSLGGDGQGLALRRAGRRGPLLRQTSVRFGDQAAEVGFEAAEGEDWAGFGDQTRSRLFHRGHVADAHVRNVRSYAPVPFFMSTRGVGILVNTTHRVTFDMACSDPSRFGWSDRRRRVDYYVFVGDSFRDLLDAYTSLTGRPKLPPAWAFGLWYICRTQANDYEAVNDACNFRREGIPCDVIGLEPGWMEKFYDLSLEKSWSKTRFPIPSYCFNGPHNFFNAIRRMGFHLELWLCCEYDFSHEAERRVRAAAMAAAGEGRAGRPGAGDELDEHLVEGRRADTITRPDIPWFDHLKKFVDQGVDFFKQDGAFQVLEHPDRVWGNGMTDDEMHNLYPLLYARQMHEGFAEHTGRRPVVFTCSGWAGFQAWAGTWTGDTGGRLDTLGGMLNTSLVGHSWATNDMEVAQKEGIHFGYLQPWSQINSWNYFRMPWVQGHELCDMHREYAQLRSRLVPYLYCWAWRATQTGYPLMTPLALEFPEDSRCRSVLHQYLLGRDLLVVIYRRRAYFPAGRWKDWWTARVVEGGRHAAVRWPANRGGGLFLRSGAIVPLGPVMQHRGEKPLDKVELHVFADWQETSMAFYEDDGVSLEHLKGAFAVTETRAVDDGAATVVTVGETRGSFRGQCRRRLWSFVIHADGPPAAVLANGVELAADAWRYDRRRREVVVRACRGPVRIEVLRRRPSP